MELFGYRVRIDFTSASSLAYQDVQSRCPDITRAQMMLDYDPRVNLKEGLKKTIEWQAKEMNESAN